MSILELLTAYITPHECLGCGAEGAVVCAACCTGLPCSTPVCYHCGKGAATGVCDACATTSRLQWVESVAPYRGLARELVYALKFERKRAAADTIAQLMAARLQQVGDANYVVTHIPTATSRIRQRGYDQAQQIARAVADRLAAPYVSLLAREGQLRQVGRGRSDRQQQMRNSLYAPRPHLVKHRRVLLIDDVLTTGSSVDAAAQVLDAAGADQVAAAVFATA